jgi:molybdate transport system regulatory protein
MAKSIKHILKRKSGYKLAGTLWIEFENERFFGPGRAELLEKIDATGSITQAAKEMNMSYKKAWQMVTALNRQAACPMVQVQTGGEGGGGSLITKEAKELIAHHRLLRKKFIAFLDQETMKLNK